MSWNSWGITIYRAVYYCLYSHPYKERTSLSPPPSTSLTNTKAHGEGDTRKPREDVAAASCFFPRRWALEPSRRVPQYQRMPLISEECSCSLYGPLHRVVLLKVSESELSKCRQVCLWVWSASYWVSWSRVHSCGEYLAPFVSNT